MSYSKVEKDVEAQLPIVSHQFSWQRKSQYVVCPKCREEIMTEIEFKVGKVSIGFCMFTVLFLLVSIWLVCITYLRYELMSVLRLFLLSSLGFLFMFLDCTLDAAHKCPNCKRTIGRCPPCIVFLSCGYA